MLFSVLKNIKFNGTIELIDSKNKKYLFGSGDPLIRVKLQNKSIEKKLFRNPGLYFGEGYMNEEILIKQGTIEELIDIVTSCYDEFVRNNPIYRTYENFSGYFKVFQQLNEAVKSKQNVSHH